MSSTRPTDPPAFRAHPRQTPRPAPIERLVLALAALIMTGVVGAVYNKLFNNAPPTPAIFLEAPILLLMILTGLIRFREALFGVICVFPLFAVALLAVISFQWSISPSDTMREAINALIVTAYLGMAVHVFNWRDLVGTLWGVTLALGLVSVATYFIAPGFGQMQDTHAGALRGLWIEKNGTGQIGVIGATLSLARLAISPRRAAGSILGYVFFVGFVLMTTSKTSLVALGLATFGFGWVFMMRRHPAVFASTTWITLFLAIPGAIFALTQGETVLGLLGRSTTFTGRAEIWSAIQDFVLDERPISGFGYGAFWSNDYLFGTRENIYTRLGFTPEHAHNSWLDMQIGLGLPGLWLLIAGFALAAAASIFRVRASRGSYFAVPFLLAMVPVSAFESSLAFPTSFAGATLILVLAGMVRRPMPADSRSTLGEFWARARRDIPAPTHPIPTHHSPSYPSPPHPAHPVPGPGGDRGGFAIS